MKSVLFIGMNFLVIIFLGAAAQAQSDSWVEGLSCMEQVGLQEVNRDVPVKVNGQQATIVIPTAAGVVRVTAPQKALQPILDGDLDAMDGKILEDAKTGAVAYFTVDGRDVSGKSRLKIETDNAELVDCHIWKNSKMSVF